MLYRVTQAILSHTSYLLLNLKSINDHPLMTHCWQEEEAIQLLV